MKYYGCTKSLMVVGSVFIILGYKLKYIFKGFFHGPTVLVTLDFLIAEV